MTTTIDWLDRITTADGVAIRVRELPEAVHTAADTAEAVGCNVASVIKSMIYRGKESGEPILVLVSGANRIDSNKLKHVAQESVEKATPEFVKETLGFQVGTVPPLGHKREIRTFIDEDLAAFDEVWGGTGHPDKVCCVVFKDLLRMSLGEVINLKEV